MKGEIFINLITSWVSTRKVSKVALNISHAAAMAALDNILKSSEIANQQIKSARDGAWELGTAQVASLLVKIRPPPHRNRDRDRSSAAEGATLSRALNRNMQMCMAMPEI